MPRQRIDISCHLMAEVITIVFVISFFGILSSSLHLYDGCNTTECHFSSIEKWTGSSSCYVNTSSGGCNYDGDCPLEGRAACYFVNDAPQPWSSQFETNRCFSFSCYNIVPGLGLCFSCLAMLIDIMSFGLLLGRAIRFNASLASSSAT